MATTQQRAVWGGVGLVPDRLLVDVDRDGRARVSAWLEGELPAPVGDPVELVWPLSGADLEDLRWYLEDYLRAPFGVYEDRGPRIADRLPEWGREVFKSLFGSSAARDAYVAIRTRAGAGRRPELVVRSEHAGWLALPWELLVDPAVSSPVVLDALAVSRSLHTGAVGTGFAVGGERLRVLMVISRPHGAGDVGYRMIARPLLARLDAVRGRVELVVLRPPTIERLREVLAEARATGEPFQVVHFDGHGVLSGSRSAGVGAPLSYVAGGEGTLVFEKRGGGSDPVSATDVARVLAAAQVPVVVLNACQSGALGKELESAVATRLLMEGASSVVAMAYSVYAVAAAEFMTAFYEHLFVGDTVTDAVTAGRARLARNQMRPSPKGRMPLQDWVVPVHYLRRDVHFPSLRQTSVTGLRGGLSLDAALDRIADTSKGESVGPRSGDVWAARDEFVGRDGLFYTLEVASRLQRVVLLHGPGGTGKTELAKAFGRWLRDTGGVDDPRLIVWHTFEQGVASFGLDSVLTSIGLQVFGVEFAKLDDVRRRQVVQDLMSQSRVLVVWDNFESVYAMRDSASATPTMDDPSRADLLAFLDRVAATGGGMVVITSRSPESWLGKDIRRIPVGGLGGEEAAEFTEQLLEPFPHTRQVRVRRVFGELLAWLDGHPLSMRLTLPLLDVIPPDVLLAGLQGTVPLVDPTDGGGDRSTSLPACVTYSISHLDSRARELLVAACLFQSVVDVDVLATFSTVEGVPARFVRVDAQEWSLVLRKGVEVGLLTPLGSGMFAIHPALTSYLANAWQGTDAERYVTERAAAEVALLTSYAAFATWLTTQIQGGDARLAFEVIERQYGTLASLLGMTLGTARWVEALEIAAPLSLFWDTRGLSAEADAWVDRTRIFLEDDNGAPPAFDQPAGALWLFMVFSQAARQTEEGKLAQAEISYTLIRDAMSTRLPARHHDDLLAGIYHQLGRIARMRGALDQAQELFTNSLESSSSGDDDPEMAATYHELGMVAHDRGLLSEARRWYQRSLALEEASGNQRGIAISYHQLGILSQDQGLPDEARRLFTSSLTIRQELADQLGMAASYHHLGILAHRSGSLAEAQDLYQRSLIIRESMGDRPGMAVSYHQLGILAQSRRRLDETRGWYQKALAVRESLGDRPGVAASYHQLGVVSFEQGSLEEAHSWFQKSLAISEALGDRLRIAGTCHEFGILAENRGYLDEAWDWYQKSLAIWKEVDHRDGIASTYHQLGILAENRGSPDEARDWYHKSLAIKKEMDDRGGLAATYGQLGLLAEADGKVREALDWFVRCMALFDEFPHPLTGPVVSHLARLTRLLGLKELTQCWREIVGGELPSQVVAYVQRPVGRDDEE